MKRIPSAKHFPIDCPWPSPESDKIQAEAISYAEKKAGTGNYPYICLIASSHWASEGYWVEFKKPEKLVKGIDSLVKEWITDTTKSPKMNNTAYDRIIAAIEKQPTKEKLITYLRTLGFHFYETHRVFESTSKTGELPIKEKHQTYSTMIRKTDNKFNHQLWVMIRLWGKKDDSVIIYYKNEYLKKLSIPWKDQADMNFKKKAVAKWAFPEYMTYEQRKQWRNEHRKVLKDPKYKGSEYYWKCKPDIIFK